MQLGSKIVLLLRVMSQSNDYLLSSYISTPPYKLQKLPANHKVLKFSLGNHSNPFSSD